MRAEVEEYSLTNDGAYAVVIEANLECFGAGELCFAHHEFGAGGFISVEMICDQGFHHLTLPVPHRRHVS